MATPQSTDEKVSGEFKTYMYLIVLGIIFLLLGIAQEVYKPFELENIDYDKFLNAVFKLLHGLGITLLTSAVLAFTFEKISRIKLAKRAEKERESIKNDVFQSIFGNFFPQKIMSEFNQSLKLGEVIKEKVINNITLSEHSSNPNYFVASIEQEFTVRNTCARPIEHNVELHLEVPLNKEHKKLAEITLVRIGKKVFSGQDLRDRITGKSKDYVVFCEGITLKPLEDIKVIFIYSTIKKSEDYELLVNLRPQSDVSVNVKAPSGTIVNADANNSISLSETVSAPNCKKWWLNHGMLPFQSITVWWKQDDEDDEPALEDSAMTCSAESGCQN